MYTWAIGLCAVIDQPCGEGKRAEAFQEEGAQAAQMNVQVCQPNRFEDEARRSWPTYTIVGRRQGELLKLSMLPGYGSEKQRLLQFLGARKQMIFRRIFLCVGALTLGMWVNTALAQKEAAKPGEGSAPAPEKLTESSPESKTQSAEKARERRSTKAADKPAEKDAPAIRLLELSGQYVDLAQPMGLDPTSLLLGGDSLKQKSFYKLCDYIDGLAKEEKVSHVVLDLSDAGLDMNPAQLDEVTRHFDKLKTSGKKLIAWLENPSNTQLALAVCCHEIVPR